MKQLFASTRRAIVNGVRYLPLLQNLIARDLKKKYRRSVLGYVWCVLNPLLVMLILNAVFSGMFRRDVNNYPVYLFSGRMMFFFITASTQHLARSIIANGALMRKTRIPYHVFPLANFCSEAVDFLFSLVAFAIVLAFTKTPVTVHVAAFPAVVLGMFMFSYGLGLFLAQANTFLRDVGYIYGVFTTAWMYLTPIFYTIGSVPEGLRRIITHYNPAYVFVQQSRMIFLEHVWPSAEMMTRGAVWGVSFLVLGLVSYAISRDKLILYV